MRKIEEVLRLHDECGRTNREIARAVRASPTTVADYLRRAQLAGPVVAAGGGDERGGPGGGAVPAARRLAGSSARSRTGRRCIVKWAARA